MTPSMETRGIRTLKLIGGWLCLDFSNTLGMHASEQASEFLRSYFDLAECSNYTGIATDEEERSLLNEAEKSPKEAEDILQEAKELREIIFRIFSSIAKNTVLQEKDIYLFNKKLSKMMRQTTVLAS